MMYFDVIKNYDLSGSVTVVETHHSGVECHAILTEDFFRRNIDPGQGELDEIHDIISEMEPGERLRLRLSYHEEDQE